MKRQPELGAPEGAVYGPLVLSTAATLTLMGLALSLLMIAAIIGPFRLFAPERASAPPPLGLWLLREPGAPLGPADLSGVRAWREAAASRRVVREGRTLPELLDQGVAVIAFPDARALSEEEAHLLKRYLERGGRVVLSGSVGVRDREGSWRGYGLMQRLLGVPEVTPLPRSASHFLASGRRGPLSAALRPSQRISLIPETGVPAIAAAGAELRWAEGAGGASLRREVGPGRLAWVAPAAGTATGSRESGSDGELSRVFAAALAWVAGEPFLELLPWPAGAPLAASVEGGAGEPASSEPPGDWRGRVDAGIADHRERGALLDLAGFAAELGAAPDGPVVAYATRRLRAEGAWLAAPGSIATWARLRGGLDTSLVRAGPRRFLLTVANRGDEPVSDAVLRVHLNATVSGVHLERTILQQREPEVRVDLRAGRVDVALPELSAGVRQVYALDLSFDAHEVGPAASLPGRRTSVSARNRMQPRRGRWAG